MLQTSNKSKYRTLVQEDVNIMLMFETGLNAIYFPKTVQTIIDFEKKCIETNDCRRKYDSLTQYILEYILTTIVPSIVL